MTFLRRNPLSYAICLVLFIYIPQAFAYYADTSTTSAGSLSNEARGVAYYLGQFFTVSSILIGLYFTLNAIMKVKAHRENPASTPLSTAIMQFIFAAFLYCLALFFYLTKQQVFG